MSDLLILVFIAMAVSWICSAVLGLICRSVHGRNCIRETFGSVRFSLYLPIIVGIAIAFTAYGLHRTPALVNQSALQLFGDQDGCVHSVSHEEVQFGNITSGFILAGLLIIVGLFSARRKLESYYWVRTFLPRIDRETTRRLRTPNPIRGQSTRVYAVRDLEFEGPFTVELLGKKLVFYPHLWEANTITAQAILAHENAHIQRRHLARRFVFETTLAPLIPSFLAKSAFVAARAEEEWEADDDAAREIGDRRNLARILVQRTEAIRMQLARSSSTFALFGEPDGLRERVLRLLNPSIAPAAGRVRFVALCSIAAGTSAAAMAGSPQWSLWMFCQVEQVLGISCF